MFYLIEFLKITQRSFLLGVIALVSSTFVIGVAHFEPEIRTKITKLGKIKSNQPYFNALIDKSTSVGKIQRKMSQLPGVISVISAGELNAPKEIEKLQKSYGDDVLSSLSKLNFTKVKIEVAQGLKSKNLKLIQEYLVRLVGKEAVTIGEFKIPSIKTGKVKLLNFLQSWGISFFIGIGVLLFALSLFLMKNAIQRHSFIIENFQRRKNVGLQIMLHGFGLIWLAVLSSLVVFTGSVNFFAMSITVALVAIVAIVGFSMQKRRAI